MTPITDKIKQLPDGLWLELRDPNGDGTEAFDLVCTSEEYNALVSELETAKRALEAYANKSSWYCATNHVHNPDDPECRADTIDTLGSGYDIAQAALKNE